MATLARRTLAALASAASMIASFFGGVTTSSMEMVTPEQSGPVEAELLQPVERLGDVDLRDRSLAVPADEPPSSFFPIRWFRERVDLASPR